jgi:hypothetical protein
MRESGYYPPGAEFDPRAPWNQVEPPEIDCAECNGTGKVSGCCQDIVIDKICQCCGEKPEDADTCQFCDGHGTRPMNANEMDGEGLNRLADLEQAGERQNEIRLGRD